MATAQDVQLRNPIGGQRRAFTKRLTMAFTAAWRGAPPFAVLYLTSTISRT
jgi:hypothetical protein